ncbi:selenoneine biosynthesis selenosugar synthase SenB [Marinobacter sp.]|uniref:selenoneine biosynthesis selenosugar synthase SenB n=1 Tax=Marinobacter sp. TaxID=50741 RepID=UPI002B49FF94|nr:selenoneine biosynthesis selenosugar synthase SenB [Marinobacter sp.]HKK57318.1 selenoneine biosynthesis selenosugar synthase SenB [Marinobacter sp.]
MDIVIITPAPAGSRAGNRATAERWARLLEREGHRIHLVTEFRDEPCDLVIALHAWRSHQAVASFQDQHPQIPVIVALTGTDIYDHQYRFPRETLDSMTRADCLIGLHQRVKLDIPSKFCEKLATVLQSADQPGRSDDHNPDDHFLVCVIGHLRDEKDSLRAALASRLLPDDSIIKVVNAGKAHSPEWEIRALEEQSANPRFEWLGEVDKPDIQALMRRSRLMVISSVMEGGANVVSEACRAGLPVIASDISGNIGLLGDDYPGYFRTGDEQDLARLLAKAEKSSGFLAELTQRVSYLAADFTPENEQASLAAAIEKARAQRAKINQSG